MCGQISEKKCHGLYQLAQIFSIFLHFAPLRKLKFITKHLLLNLKPSVPGLSGDNFRFDVNGDGPARYNIIHYKQVSPGNYQWVNVGYFQDDKIQLNMDGKRMLDLLSQSVCKKKWIYYKMAKLNIEKQTNHAFTTKKVLVGSWAKLYEII